MAMLRRSATTYDHADELGSITSLSNAAGSLAPYAILELVDRLIDTVMPNRPLGQSKLGSPLSNIYWVSEGIARIYFVVCEPDTIVITRLSTTPRPVSRMQKADALMRQMVASGQLNRSTSVH